jgi:hypothetical protein
MACRTCGYLGLVAVLCGLSVAQTGDEPQPRDTLKEPVLRVAKASSPSVKAHPLDPALEIARKGLETIHSSVTDYTCMLVKRERINSTLGDYEYIQTKVRNRKEKDGKVVRPFAVYMYFVKPASMKGREVLYIEGANGDKMIAHEGGAAGKYLPTVWLKPNGIIAMRGQRYPITDVGIENLVLKLIERGERDRANGPGNCEVTFHKDAKINGRTCTLLQVKHAQPAPNLDFHMGQIFIDDELQVPVRYAAYGFPAKDGDELPVIEEYTYLNLKLNVGLADADFDHTSKQYAFQ